MSDAPTRYPLAWPAGRPRTTARRAGQFRYGERPITVAAAMSRLDAELERLGADYAVLSSGLRVRLDGSPVLNAGMPSDPGVCVYFNLGEKPFALACDTFTEVAQNIAALAGHVEATRRIERYGVASAAESLQAFSALPPPSPENRPARPWWVVLDLAETASLEVAEAAYRAKAKAAVLAAGGDTQNSALIGLNLAIARAREALK